MKRLIAIGLMLNALLLAGRFWQELPARAEPGRAAGEPAGAGDMNYDGFTDVSDAVFLLRYLFSDGPEPCMAQESPLTPEQEAVLSVFSLEDDTLRIEGVNVQVVNGEGQTESANGLGNLVVGYNEPPAKDADRTGSHNLVVGAAHSYASYCGLVAGRENAIAAPSGTVIGGEGNLVEGELSTIVGGGMNVAAGALGTVAGGRRNAVSGMGGVVVGGQDGEANGAWSTVRGGDGLTAACEFGAESGRSCHRVIEGFTFLGVNAGGRAEYIHDSTGMVFVHIPGATFLMGPPEDETGRDDDETQHQVTLSPYLIAKYEVTQGVYEEVMGENPSRFDLGKDHPVENVSWHNAGEFCAKAGLELPTEAQWEHACRAGTSGARYGPLEDIAWYRDNLSIRTHPVGRKEPNPWGLHDMLGNVWEWCGERDGEYPKGPVEVSTGPAAGKDRVVRGGSWLNHTRVYRAGFRRRYSPSRSSGDLGFRPARSLP